MIIGGEHEREADSDKVVIGDIIQFQVRQNHRWRSALILGKLGEVEGEYCHWLIRDDESMEEICVDLLHIFQWRKIVNSDDVVKGEMRSTELTYTEVKPSKLHEVVLDTG